jgi:hypothetical protein
MNEKPPLRENVSYRFQRGRGFIPGIIHAVWLE